MKMISAISLLLLTTLTLTACCDMDWYGGCRKRIPIQPAVSRQQARAYGHAQEKKVVEGLGGDLYPTN